MGKKLQEIQFEAYDKMREGLETGDIVLFSGKGFWSRLIGRSTESEWSHIGMVVHIKEWDLCLLLESNNKGEIRDVDNFEFKGGVQLVPLSGKIKVYKGKIAIRKLIPPENDAHLKEKMHSEMASVRKKYRDVPYEKNLWDLIRLANPFKKFWKNSEEDSSSVFCSELVSLALIQLGILPDNLPGDDYSPANYDQKKTLKMTNGWSLGEEIHLFKDVPKPK